MEWLKAIRMKHGLSQNAAAEEIGITQASYSNIESGKRKPRIETAKLIGNRFGFCWARFYEDEDAAAGKEARE